MPEEYANMIGRKEPTTVYNPQKPGQSSPLSAVQDGIIQASFFMCYAMLWLVLPRSQR